MSAAKAVGGKALLPIFAPSEQASNPKGFTGLNNLATKSALGQEGIKRQVGSFVAKAVNQHQAQAMDKQNQQQKRVEKQGSSLRKSMKI